MTTETDQDTPPENFPETANPEAVKRFNETQIVQYLHAVVTDQNLSIPAPMCAIHTESIEWLEGLV